jgi:probable HAF family extracellular repeat protein
MQRQIGVALLVAWAAVCGLAGSSEAQTFRYENLGTLGGDHYYNPTGFYCKQAGINSTGQVTGKSFTAAGVLHAFIKTPGQPMVDLGALIPASDWSLSTCLNNSGTVFGWYVLGPGNHACKWTPIPGGAYTFEDLGGTDSAVHGTNEAGYLVGRGDSSGGASHAYVVPPGEAPLDLGTLPGHVSSQANGINGDGTIVGYSVSADIVITACYWSPAGAGYAAAADLFGIPGRSSANAINSAGKAVGFAPNSGTSQAVLKAPGLAPQFLGELVPGGYSEAFDINDSDWVVGMAQDTDGFNAFLWTPAGGMKNLNELVANLPAGLKLLYAMAINQQGEIAGYAPNGVFRLIPYTNPALTLLLLD